MWALNRTTESAGDRPAPALIEPALIEPAWDAELPVRVASVAEPVGAVVTDTGVTFGIAPLRPFSRPIRLTCTQCSWQVAVVGLPAIGERVRDHARQHDPVPEPAPAGRFGSLLAAVRSGGLLLIRGGAC